MKKQVKKWLKFANIDILSAKKLLEDENLTQSVSFHCHQAIEKSMKAILENLNVRIPRIHDLENLYGILKSNNINIKLNEDILDQINDVYVDSRYPCDSGLVPDGMPSIEKAKQFYETAYSINKNINEILSND